MVMKQYRVMIVDDHPLMRRGIKQLLGLDARFSVVAEAGNGSEAVALALQHTPDVILLDLNMKGMSGLDTLRALRDEGVDARIIVLTVSDARSDLYALIDTGADGYLLKDSEPEQLLEHQRRRRRAERDQRRHGRLFAGARRATRSLRRLDRTRAGRLARGGARPVQQAGGGAGTQKKP